MAAFAPNFFIERGPWTEIAFGSGAPVKAALTKIDGVSTKHKWKEQRSKEKSGSVNVFAGTEWGHPELEFTAVNAEDFDDLRALWDLMKPVPGQGSGTAAAATPAPGQTFAIGSPAKAEKPAAGGASTTTDPTDASAKKDDAKKDDPGPRPPTIAVHNPLLAWHDITACALEEWTGPTPTDTNGLVVKIKIIPDKPQTPAGTGAMAAPAPGSQFAGGAAGNAGGGGAAGGAAPAGGGSGSMNTNAGQGAAGT